LRKMALLRWGVDAVGAGSVPGGAVASPTCDSKILKLPAVANRLRGKPSAAEIRGVGAATPTCDSKHLKVGYTAVTIRESASARRLAEHQRTAPQV
jgi:hypothetical protein